jgi:hypothetical protein
MKIDASDRVVYAHNPLAEVVCQVQWRRQLLISILLA